MAGATWPGRRRECGRLQHAVGSAIGVLAGVDPGARCPDHRGDHHHRHRLDLGLRRYRGWIPAARSEEHTSELQSLMRISYAVFCLKKKKHTKTLQKTDTVLSHKTELTRHNN